MGKRLLAVSCLALYYIAGAYTVEDLNVPREVQWFLCNAMASPTASHRLARALHLHLRIVQAFPSGGT